MARGCYRALAPTLEMGYFPGTAPCQVRQPTGKSHRETRILDISGLILLILLGMLLWFWQDTLRMRELALQAANEICHRQQLQLLDATVTLQRVAVRRLAGRAVLQRTFQFTYSRDGDDRLAGFVITTGNHVEQVGL